MNVLEKILEEIDKLKEKCLLPELESGYAAGALDMANAIKDVIHKCESDNDGWIPAEERLPGMNETLFYDMQLVTLKDGSVCFGVYRNKDAECWTRKQEGERFYTNTREVIAWQPLPESYRRPKKEKSPCKEHIMSRFAKVE
ncbi:hypothetical protein [[Ruminococcus] torques]|uniref:hypothetical protein n=1 Tax=[Ruminococcus] torques TaxID=33039 RepID=UPI0026DD5D44|nr:hypothetical protein [[Ruminococcus] torques]